MKLTIKDVYGIIGPEINFDSKDKQHMVIFAPNGVGKTSIFKGLKNAFRGEQYNAMENTNPMLTIKLKDEEYFFNLNNPNSQVLEKENIGFIKQGNIDTNLDIIKSTLANEYPKNEMLADKKIKDFLQMIVKEHNEKDWFIKYLNMEVVEIISLIEEELKNKQNRKLKDIKLEIAKKQKVLTQINEIKNLGSHIKRVDEYASIYSTNNSPEEVNSEKLLDLKIIKDIKEQKKDKADVFGYKIKNAYKPVSDIDEEWINEISQKYSAKEIEFILSIPIIESLIPTKVNGEYKQTRLNPFSKRIEKKLNDLKEIKFNLIIQKHSKKFEKLKKDYDKTTNNIIKITNSKISKINNFFKKDTLDWTISISKISSISDTINIKLLFEKNIREWVEFDEYASEGQKRILKLIISLIDFYKKNATVIMDDVFSSLDNHHINEILEVISDKSFKEVDFLILSHNFEWLRSLSFHSKINQELAFFAFDKIDRNKFTRIDIKEDELKYIGSPKNFDFKEKDSIKKIVILSNIAREVLENYLLPKESTYPKNDLNFLKNNTREIKKAIKFLDANIRHYKGNITIKKLSSSFNQNISNCLLHLPIISEIQNEILKLKNKNEIFGDLVIDEKIDWHNSKNFSDYIGNKIFFGTYVRFKTEFEKFYSRNDLKTQKARKKMRIIR